MKETNIVRACDRHSVLISIFNAVNLNAPILKLEPLSVALTKHVTKYKYIRKWMVEFLSKSQSHVVKIARVCSIRMTKYINLH